MTIELMPELGVELTPDISFVDLRDRAQAACNSIALLEKHGLDTQATPADRETAATLTAAYAENPEKTSKMVNTVRASTMTPASLTNIRTYLDEYGRQVVTHAIEMRHLVTNRLLEESQNPDPRIRIRALELLGKHSDVGLFSEKQEVTITHQTTDELKERLRGKLQKLMRRDSDVVDVDTKVTLGGEVVDLDDELGLKSEAKPEIRENSAQTGTYFEPEPDVDPENPDGEPVQ